MNVFQALILGVVQGLGEFLPISSSGHLVLVQEIFGINEGAMTFDIIVHLGTLISLCIVMRKKLAVYLRHPLGRVPRMVVLGTVPTVLMVLALNDFFESMFETGSYLGYCFLFTAVLLWFAEYMSGRAKAVRERKADGKAKNLSPAAVVPRGWNDNRDRTAGAGSPGMRRIKTKRRREALEKEISPGSALLVGFFQGIAVAPAVSRSGSTMAGGLIAGLSRKAAVEFAFLMSIPITLLAVAQDILKVVLPDFFADGASGAAAAETVAAASVPAATAAVGALELIAGAAAATVVGYFAARFMLAAISKIKLTWFSLYVALLGALVLADQHVFHLVFNKGM